jgi:hypothetical protein
MIEKFGETFCCRIVDDGRESAWKEIRTNKGMNHNEKSLRSREKAEESYFLITFTKREARH